MRRPLQAHQSQAKYVFSQDLYNSFQIKSMVQKIRTILFYLLIFRNYFWLLNAAPTNSRNNGCGRCGREINSGWN